jgi:hypothetical protein
MAELNCMSSRVLSTCNKPPTTAQAISDGGLGSDPDITSLSLSPLMISAIIHRFNACNIGEPAIVEASVGLQNCFSDFPVYAICALRSCHFRFPSASYGHRWRTKNNVVSTSPPLASNTVYRFKTRFSCGSSGDNCRCGNEPLQASAGANWSERMDILFGLESGLVFAIDSFPSCKPLYPMIHRQ